MFDKFIKSAADDRPTDDRPIDYKSIDYKPTVDSVDRPIECRPTDGWHIVDRSINGRLINGKMADLYM